MSVAERGSYTIGDAELDAQHDQQLAEQYAQPDPMNELERAVALLRQINRWKRK